MTERKTIQINPELFKFSTTNKTRKKRDKIVDPNKPIRIKSPRKESAKSSRNRLLKYIRQHQDAKYKHMTDPQSAQAASSTSADSGFESDFEDSLKYLSTIAEKAQHVVPASAIQRHNATLRNPSSLMYHSMMDPARGNGEYVNTELPDVFQSISIPSSDASSPIELKPMRFTGEMPKYGCLKNGTLPTYRMWKNQTMKALPSPVPAPIPRPPVSAPGPTPIIVAGNRLPTAPSFGEFQKHREIQKRREIPKRIRAQKQRRIMRRTYRVGKSKHYPKVAVLVSNKTLRKEITTKTQLLKQVPIEEVKKMLIKKGLIKVGSTAPNDVLRKMYESISLVCGDIQNHNPDNLLYNYFNDHT